MELLLLPKVCYVYIVQMLAAAVQYTSLIYAWLSGR